MHTICYRRILLPDLMGRLVVFFALAMLLVVSPAAIAVQGQVVRTGYDLSSILVQFKPGTSTASQALALSNAGCANTGKLGQTAVNTGRNIALQQNSRQNSGLLVHATIISGQSVDRTLQSIQNNPVVLFAERNYYLSAALTIPNDPQFSQLYALNNTGQTGGTADADMDAVEAWDLTTGSEIIVAVTDSGIDLSHADLAANIWSNTKEIPNNNLDDDGNGYIDDVNGWDFANNDNNPSDDNDHGSHVSGTIAAVGNNGVGISGVTWRARIMPLKFMTAAGVGTTADAIAAIDYAVANGARVINASWGGPNFSAALQTSISLANDAGILFVAAAGNNNSDNDFFPEYPASYTLPNIIAVAATDANDVWANFSNWGLTSVDLGAPGVGILSTVRANGYASMNGTSMAAPQVAGAVALLWSYNPDVTAAQIKAALLGSVDPVPSLTGWTVSGGSLNVFSAMNTLPAPPVIQPLLLTPSTASLRVGTNIQFTSSGGVPPYVWSSSNTQVASINPTTGFLNAIALGTTRVTVTDATGTNVVSGVIRVSNIVISPAQAAVDVNGSQLFTATGGIAPYTWSVMDATIASIDQLSGLATGLAGGTTRIMASDSVGDSATAQLQVITVTLTPSSGTTSINGGTIQFSAAGGTPPYIWSSTSYGIAAINANGLMTGTTFTGSVVISATDANGIIGRTAPIIITAAPPAVTLAPMSGTLASGMTLQFNASGGIAPFSFSSSTATVASIDPTSGLLTALSAGTTTVTVIDSSGRSATSATITVIDITILPQNAGVNVGSALQMAASGGTAPYSWSVADTTLATIDALSGLLTGVAIGQTNVTVTDANGYTGNTNINVQTGGLTIFPQSTSIAVGSTQFFSCSGCFMFVTWTSSDANIASMSFNTLTGLAPGVVVITATDGFGNSGSSGAITITP